MASCLHLIELQDLTSTAASTHSNSKEVQNYNFRTPKTDKVTGRILPMKAIIILNRKSKYEHA